MFRSLSITNFRGFGQFKVQGLDRINLFLGKNNVGKSALLESVFLLAGPMNAELPLRLHGFRGIGEVHGDAEELWGWLFYGKDIKRHITLELEPEARKNSRSLKMRVMEQKITRAKKKGPEKSKGSRSLETTSKSTIPMELHLEYRTEMGHGGEARAFFREGAIAFEHGKVSSFPTSVFVPARSGYSPENAQRFSKLQELMTEMGIIPSLQILEPRLKKLSVLVSGLGSMVCGDIGIGRMVPAPMMGEGIGRLLTILLAVAEAKGGLIMVDEIDTGFHYSVLSDVWSAIAKTAREADTQIFATTHSWECLKAAHESFSRCDPYDLRVHRLDRVEEEVRASTYDREMVEAALVSGLEMR